MVAVANLQYGWTLFVHPLHDKYGWSLASIQTAFAIFVVAETWLVPFEGWVVDRFGPKFVVAAGGLVVAAAWTLNSVADSLFLLYLGAALGGWAPARSMEPAWAMPCAGFPTAAASPPVSPWRVSARARRSASSRSRT